MWRLTDEERELREHVRSVVLDQVRPRVRELDENCDYPHDVHETLAREGLMGLALPSEYGGRDSSEVSWCAYVEELAKISGTVVPWFPPRPNFTGMALPALARLTTYSGPGPGLSMGLKKPWKS